MHLTRQISLIQSRFISKSRFLCNVAKGSTSIKGKEGDSKISFRQINKRLLESIEREIKNEGSSDLKISIPENWHYELSENQVKLSKSVEYENVLVTFDPINSEKYPITSEHDGVDGVEPGNESFICAPELRVAIDNKEKGSVVFNLSFTCDDEEIEEMDEIDEFEDETYDLMNEEVKECQFDDQSPVSFKLKHGIWCDIKNMEYYDKDGNLIYKMDADMFDNEYAVNMISFLSIRGVDTNFLNSILSLSGQLDSQLYLNFLKSMKNYLSK